jgi:hypothetical protein
MTRRCFRPLCAGLPTLALVLDVLFLSACGEAPAPPAPSKDDAAQATGTIVLITSPWAPTGTGTLTIILSKSMEDR